MAIKKCKKYSEDLKLNMYARVRVSGGNFNVITNNEEEQENNFSII